MILALGESPQKVAVFSNGFTAGREDQVWLADWREVRPIPYASGRAATVCLCV